MALSVPSNHPNKFILLSFHTILWNKFHWKLINIVSLLFPAVLWELRLCLFWNLWVPNFSYPQTERFSLLASFSTPTLGWGSWLTWGYMILEDTRNNVRQSHHWLCKLSQVLKILFFFFLGLLPTLIASSKAIIWVQRRPWPSFAANRSLFISFASALTIFRIPGHTGFKLLVYLLSEFTHHTIYVFLVSCSQKCLFHLEADLIFLPFLKKITSICQCKNHSSLLKGIKD